MDHSWLDNLRLKIRLPSLVEKSLVFCERKHAKNRGNLNPQQKRTRLLLDVSVISRHDAGTGIQRVVRAVFNELKNSIENDLILCPIAASKKRPYSYVEWNGIGNADENGREVTIQATDVFLGLDFSTHAITKHRRQLAKWKKKGAALFFIIHDLLPEEHPEWFSTQAVISYRRWIRAISVLADGVFCNSKDTETRFQKYLFTRYGFSKTEIPTHVMPMGFDITSTSPTRGIPPNAKELIQKICAAPSALIIGTLEPRKGHTQVLAAFNAIWRKKLNYNLVIVGRAGWKTKSLQDEIQNHSEINRKLFWFNDASDDLLQLLYRECDGIIISSLAEGYGLPMMEAIGHSKPILVRDIEVFREQANTVKIHNTIDTTQKVKHIEPIEFFTTTDHSELSAIIRSWLDRIFKSSIVYSCEQVPTWKSTATFILSEIKNFENQFN